MQPGSRLLTRLFSALAMLASFACASSDAGEARKVPFETQRREIVRSATGLARSYAAGDGKAACHDDSAEVRTPALLLAVSADQCLSCKSVGSVARDLVRRARDSSRVVLVTPLADTNDVCRFLRVERVQMPVVGLDGQLFLDTALTSDLVVLGVRANGTVSSLLHARDALDLLAKGRALDVEGGR